MNIASDYKSIKLSGLPKKQEQKQLPPYLIDDKAVISNEKIFKPYGKVVFLTDNVKFAENKVRKGYDRSNLDTSIKPGNDFYKFAVGGFMAKHPIPPEEASYGVFNLIREENEKKLKEILENAEKQASSDPSKQKIGDFYASGMDLNKIEAFGVTPLLPEFQRIQNINTIKDLQEEVAHLHTIGVDACFRFGSTQDLKNPNMIIGEAFQGGIGLPDRDYYLKDDDASLKLRSSYKEHVAKMFELLGDDKESAKTASEKVMEIETSLAKASLTNVELRDPYKLYNIMNKEELSKLTPNFSWDSYFAGLGSPNQETINIATPNFFAEFDKTLAVTPLDDWKTYLRWRVIDSHAAFLSSSFVDENFNFKGRILNGVEQMEPRWKKVVGYTDRSLGEILGKEFVKEHFSSKAKERVLDMINNMKLVLKEKIAKSNWMGDETKKEATAKVDTLLVKVGYPDKWKDYFNLKIDRKTPFVNNVMNANRFAVKEDLLKIGNPVDRTLWGMTPPTVNAYYNPSINEIVFPAGILQPPFFDIDADNALNYGGIGAVIGHELSHGFDDQGSQFDSLGRLRNWWQPEDLARFTERADGVKKQFSELEFDGIKVKGELVCGEAMGDLGGIELAYASCKKDNNGQRESGEIDGFTEDQRFFLSFALTWAGNIRKEYAHLLMNTDPHPLKEFRVNATLANISAFHKAFDLKEGDPMVRQEKDRNKLWD